MKRYIFIFLAILFLIPQQTKNFAQENDPYIVFMSVRNFYDYATGSSDRSQRTGGLYAVLPDGSDEHLIVSFEEVETALQVVEGDYVREMSLSPDGTRVAAVLALRHRLSSGLEGIPPEAIFDPESMPTQLFLVNLPDKSVEQLTDDERFKPALTWSPNGTYIAYAQTTIDHDNDTVNVINVETGETNQISLSEVDLTEIAPVLGISDTATLEAIPIRFSYLSWSPDGEELAISVRVGPEYLGYYTVLIARADGSEIHPITHDRAISITTAAWHPQQAALITACEVRGNHICQYDLETADITPVFSFSIEELGIQFDWINGLDVSADGRIVFSAYTPEPANKMWVYTPETETLDILSLDETSTSFNYFPHWFGQLPLES